MKYFKCINPKSLVKPFDRKFGWLVRCFLLLALAGCGQEDTALEQIEVIDTGTGNQSVTTEGAAPASETQQESSPEKQTNPAGSYALSMGKGTVSLSATSASRMAILEDISTQAGIKLISTSDVEAPITTELESVSMDRLLDNLLSDVPYMAGYGKTDTAENFRIKSLLVGAHSENLSNARSQISGSEISAATDLPQASGDIFLGSDPEEVDLAQRLQYGAPDDRAIAVSELMMDPAGFNAAYQLFSRDDSPEVRLAVLELVESEDYYLARQMVVASLQDPSKDIVLYALGIVDSLGDFSLVPQVEALMNHYDSEVAEYAKEVRESLTSGYFDPIE